MLGCEGRWVAWCAICWDQSSLSWYELTPPPILSSFRLYPLPALCLPFFIAPRFLPPTHSFLRTCSSFRRQRIRHSHPQLQSVSQPVPLSYPLSPITCTPFCPLSISQLRRRFSCSSGIPFSSLSGRSWVWPSYRLATIPLLPPLQLVPRPLAMSSLLLWCKVSLLHPTSLPFNSFIRFSSYSNDYNRW